MSMDRADKAILVVEDDPDLQQTLESALKSAGYQAFCASNLREAVVKLTSMKFACILLDLRLGAEAGEKVIDLARNPKALENNDTPILVISGNIDKDALLRLAPQIKGALVKPFDMAELLAQVDALTGVNQAA